MSNTQSLGTIPPEVMETAADWCDRLHSLSAFERRQLKTWLGASDENARAFSLVRRAMLDVALLDAAAELTEPAEKLLSPAFVAWLHQQFSKREVWFAAAGALAAAGLILVLAPARQGEPKRRCKAGSSPRRWANAPTTG